jgi:hypothetical protein
MKIIKMRPSEVLTIYFDQANPIDLPYPGLAAPFDAPTERLEEDLFGWNRLFLDRRHILWSCPDRLAVVLLEVSDAIYLFTFTQAGDFEGCLDLLRCNWNL